MRRLRSFVELPTDGEGDDHRRRREGPAPRRCPDGQGGGPIVAGVHEVGPHAVGVLPGVLVLLCCASGGRRRGQPRGAPPCLAPGPKLRLHVGVPCLDGRLEGRGKPIVHGRRYLRLQRSHGRIGAGPLGLHEPRNGGRRERTLARERGVGDHGEGPLVGACIDVLAGELFWAHVGQGAEQRAGRGEVEALHREPLGEPEVEQLDEGQRLVIAEEEVRHFDVAVHHPLRMRRRQGLSSLIHHVDGFFHRQRPLSQALAEGLTLQKLHDDEAVAVIGQPLVEDPQDVGVPKLGRDAGLLHEADVRHRMGVALGAHHLDRHVGLKAAVVRAPDDAGRSLRYRLGERQLLADWIAFLQGHRRSVPALSPRRQRRTDRYNDPEALLRVISPETPDLVVGSLLFRPGRRKWSLGVVAKLSETLTPGRCRPRPAMPLVPRDRFHDGPGTSLRHARDLVPPKARPEYVVVGSVFALQATQELVVGVGLGAHRKRLRVMAVRQRMADEVQLGPPWRSRPLRWELSARSDDNPVGVPPDGRNLPSILPLEGDGPAGLGPLRADWPARRDRLQGRTLDEDELHATTLDDGFDRRYFQVAPEDQWLDVIRVDQALHLEHLHPERAQLSTRLSGRRPVARVARDGEAEDATVPLVADTLLLDTDEGIVTVVWRGEVELSDANEAGTVRVGILDGDTIDWPDDAPPSITTSRDDTLEMDPQRAERARTQTNTEVLSPEVQRVIEEARGADGPAWLRRKPEKVPPSTPPPAPARPAPDDAPSEPSRVSEPPRPPPRWSPPAKAPRSEAPRVRPPNPARDLIEARPVSVASDEEAEPEASPSGTTGPLEVIWYDDDAPARVRRETGFAEFMAPPPAPAKPEKPKRGEPPAPPPAPPDPDEHRQRERCDLVRTLAEAEGIAPAALPKRLREALLEPTRDPPLVVIAGRLALGFDPVAHLEATVAVAQTLAKTSKQLAEALAQAEEAQPSLPRAPGLAEPLRHRIEEAWRRTNRAFPPTFLEETVERSLLEGRDFRAVKVLGGTFVRAELHTPETALTVVYVPDGATPQLPLFATFAARLLATVVPSQDAGEVAPLALRAHAIGRVLT